MPAVRHQHLAEFAESRDEAAFAQVVEEFGGLVFTSAQRRTGDRDLAEEVAQNVFAIAARKARKLACHPSLPAWFYTTIKLEAAKALRSRQRHNRRVEALAEEMNSSRAAATHDTMSAEERENWRHALPLLDESLDRLSPAEREMVLGRYFEERSFKEIATASGSSEAACKMRLKRALGKLNRWLSGRGVTLSAAALAAGLTAEFAKGAPSAVAATLPANALAASAGVSSATILTNTLNTMSTIKSASLAAVAVLAIGSIPVALQQSQATDLKKQIADLEERGAVLAPHSTADGGDRPTGDRRGNGGGGAATKPVGDFLAELEKPLDADELITEVVAAMMSRDMGQMMRVMLPLADLTSEEGKKLLDDVAASKKSPQMKEITVQMLSMMTSEPDESPGSALDRHLEHGVDARNISSRLRDWAKQDADAAIAWFESRRDSGKLLSKGVADQPEARLMAGLVAGLAEADPDRAISLLDDVSIETRNVAVGELAVTLAHGDADRRALAGKLVAAIESPDDKAIAAQSAASELSQAGKLAEAVEFIRACDLDDNALAMAIAAAAITRGDDPSRTWHQRVAWAMQNAPESARDELIGELALRGYRSDPAAVSKWVDALPEGAERDAGLAAEANSLSQHDQSQKALKRAEEIGDPKVREASIRRTFVWLHHRSSEAAARLAKDNGYQLDAVLKR